MSPLFKPVFTFALFVFMLHQRVDGQPLKNTYVYAPTFNAGANRMIFQTNANKYKVWQLYESAYVKGQWQKPIPIININNNGNTPQASNNFQSDFIGTPCLSLHGDTLYFSATFSGGQGGKDLYFSVRADSTWSKPVNLGNQINSAAGEESPSITADGKTIYFTRHSSTGNNNKNISCYRIFSSTKNELGEWSRPVALPSNINQGCEKAPRILADNVTLVFSSLRDGSDNFDLYVSVRSMTEVWTQPKRIRELSTENSDYYVNVNEPAKRVYFNTSSGNSYTLTEYSGIPPLLELQKFYMLSCSLVDSITGALLKGEIKLSVENENHELINHWRGVTAFTRKVYGHNMFRITAEADGYERRSFLIDLQNKEEYVTLQLSLPSLQAEDPGSPFVKNFSRKFFGDEFVKEAPDSPVTHDTFLASKGLDTTLQSKSEENEIRFTENISFNTGEYQISPEMTARLMTMIDFVKRNKKKVIEIVGSADDVGSEAFNLQLSSLRAEAVKKYLIKMGIDENKIITKAVGEMQPVAPNTSSENRAANRRAVVSVK
ncbi:OmpA family protein [Chryseosolibacter indicus]|uniref:OmpA family protein n=1 Tax=Chryseosolibacter indicus TaxID=2782351 RepID=A0ABS5VYH7_9BACT|nr:OmpA family protein [Chryseosolibacter indicus]MBT1706118.1 OmpA family protein [Chryseosolibacter indicus]